MLHTYYKAFLQDWPVNDHTVSESISVSVLHMLVVHCTTELHVVFFWQIFFLLSQSSPLKLTQFLICMKPVTCRLSEQLILVQKSQHGIHVLWALNF